MKRRADKFNYIIPISVVLIVISIISFFVFWRVARIAGDLIIAQDIERLTKVFQQIDKDSIILEFEHQRNYIDFLNVTKFVGSEVGAMNLKYPAQWKGPYLPDNPTYQEKLYEIIKTKKGWYIVPGYGVKLNNGKIIGKAISYDEAIDIEKLMQDGELLNYKGKPLAARLNLSSEKLPEIPVVLDVADIE